MKVKTGLTIEIGSGKWAKHSVEVGDNDLRDWLAKYDLPGDTSLTPQLRYEVMENIAQKLLITHFVLRHEDDMASVELERAVRATAILAAGRRPVSATRRVSATPRRCGVRRSAPVAATRSREADATS